MSTFTAIPVSLKTLLERVRSGKIQLPDFQRGWVWDDDRIKDLLISISRGFPVGAVMTLDAGGDIRFRSRLIEGSDGNGIQQTEQYLLDGQQRLTSLYQAIAVWRAGRDSRPAGREQGHQAVVFTSTSGRCWTQGLTATRPSSAFPKTA